MPRFLLVLVTLMTSGRAALAFTCPANDINNSAVGVGCPVVVYLPGIVSEPGWPTRVTVVRDDDEVEISLERTGAVEERDVTHSAYCPGSSNAIAERVDHEVYTKVAFTVTDVVEGEELRIYYDALGDALGYWDPQWVSESAECRTEPLEDTWCGASWPGGCSSSDPDGVPVGEDDAAGCAAGHAPGALLGVLVPLLARRRRASARDFGGIPSTVRATRGSLALGAHSSVGLEH